ncbi:DUF1127 domain-containing protein [Mesorhizobium sp. M0488]|uniref:DUF1127 domain-containing protein n=1 Tax=unclassified Mesorhizobium TaxID=325217 RepID=UPI00333BE000
MTNTLASAPDQAARPGMLVEPVSGRHLTVLRSIVAIWRERTLRERIRFRWQLGQMLKNNPHLIDDIGLTKQQVEAEIAKRFWQP